MTFWASTCTKTCRWTTRRWTSRAAIEKARQFLIDKTTELIWAKTHETEFLEVYLKNGSVDTLYWKDLVSGALLTSVVERAKDYAIKRSIDVKSTKEGVSWDDMERAVRTEFKENEIFPKTDNWKTGSSSWTTSRTTSCA